MKGKKKVNEASKKKREVSPKVSLDIDELFGKSESESEEGPGPKSKKVKIEKKGSKEDIVNNLRQQKVLNGWVFDPKIISKPGMRTLVDAVEIQSWTHLFTNHTHVLHEQQVMDFYYNIEFTEDGILNTRVGG
ncbi:hypothetical protein KY284_030534 [Solanum tuberosum]|nr:hypothetical protein KY284_030534 [Solanum tuberosum]